MLNINGSSDINGITKITGSGNYSISDAFINLSVTNFGNNKIDIKLDPSVVKTRGSYAIIYSSIAFTGFAGVNSVTFTATPPFSYSNIYTTPAGVGELVSVSGVSYYAVVVSIT